MDRRTVLKQIGGASAVGALAGCIGVQEQDSTETPASDGGSDDGGSDDTDEDTPTARPAGTAEAWYALSDSELEAREGAVQAFNDESRHTLEQADIAEMQDRTTTAIPAGQGPHVFEWAHDWVGDYSDRGFLVDQSDKLSVSLDQFTDAAAQAVQYQDTIVGLPHDAETVTLIYNADIVDEAPETVDDMLAAMDDYHNPSENQYGLSWPFDPYFASGVAQAFGGYYFDPQEDPVLGLDQQATIEGFEFAIDNLTQYMPNDPGYGPQEAAFMEGNSAFIINGPWYINTLNESDINYEIMTFPTMDDGEFSPYTGISMWYFSKKMENEGPDATAGREFVEWYTTNEELILENAKEQGSIPVLDSLVGDDELPKHVQVYAETVDQGIPMPTDSRMNDVWAALEEPIVEIFNENKTPEEALTAAAEDVRSNWE